MNSSERKIDPTKVDMAVVSELINELKPALVAMISGTRKRYLVLEWMTGISEPSLGEYEHIAFTLEIFDKVANDYNADMARLWILQGDVEGFATCEAIRLGFFDKVRAATQRFIDNVP